MNQKTAKLIRKACQSKQAPYRPMKAKWNTLTPQQRRSTRMALKEEMA